MDQIANMLIAIKNGGAVKKTTVTVPHSKMKEAIAVLLKTEGYIKIANNSKLKYLQLFKDNVECK